MRLTLSAARGAAAVRSVRVAHARCVQASSASASAPLSGADAQRLVRARAAALHAAAAPLPSPVHAKVARAINGCVRCAARGGLRTRLPCSLLPTRLTGLLRDNAGIWSSTAQTGDQRLRSCERCMRCSTRLKRTPTQKRRASSCAAC